MIAEIFSVGTEILLGEILDSNAKYIASELASFGIDVYYKTSVGDNRDRMLNAIKIAYERADMIIATGGLGPTDDDLTKEIFATYFNKKLVIDDKSMENIKKYFKDPSKMPISNIKQAEVPEGCEVLINDNGLASGCIIRENGKIAIILPGPPKECVPMFKDKVRPVLKTLTNKTLVSKSLNIYGIGESRASEIIKDLMLCSKNPTIAPYADNNQMRFRLTASGANKSEAENILMPIVDKLYSIFGDYIYGEDEDTLESVLVNTLIEQNYTIATAESCTGGLLASTIIDIQGASKVFLNGVVSYSNESKIYELDVKEEDLEKYGAVSETVAIQMAEGIKNKSKADIGIATTGIAGPTGATSEKPVGLVYIAIAIGDETIYKEYLFKGNRKKIREYTVVTCIGELLNLLKN